MQFAAHIYSISNPFGPFEIIYLFQTLKRRFLLEDIKGKKLPAIEVFSACIRYLKEHLENNCRLAIPDLRPDDIRWVLTVPAIWNDASKQFMREAAEKVEVF